MSVNEAEKLLAEAVSRFGAEAKRKLANPAAAGAPEDQLRAPLERLFKELEAALGMAAHDAVLVGESSLSDLKTRPDYAVTRKGALMRISARGCSGPEQNQLKSRLGLPYSFKVGIG